MSCAQCLRLWRCEYVLVTVHDLDPICQRCRQPLTDEDELVFVANVGYFHERCAKKGEPE